MKKTSSRLLVTCVDLACFSLGCGGGHGPRLETVTGTVLMNGEPVRGVNVTFIPHVNGSPYYGRTNENGEYQLMFNQHRAGAEVGVHTVLI